MVGLTSAKNTCRNVISDNLNVRTDEVEKDDLPGRVRVMKDTAGWKCPRCCIQIQHRQNIARHQALNCEIEKVQNIDKDKNPCSKQKEYNCDLCDVKYKVKTTLTAHMKSCHLEQYCYQNGQSLFKCPVCAFISSAERFLKQHMVRFHMDKGSFTCKFCDKKYRNNDSLRVHIKKSHIPEKKAEGHEDQSTVAEPAVLCRSNSSTIGSNHNGNHGNILTGSNIYGSNSKENNIYGSNINANTKNKNYERFNELMRNLESSEVNNQSGGGLMSMGSSEDEIDFTYEIPGGCVPDWLGIGGISDVRINCSETDNIIEEGGKNYINL